MTRKLITGAVVAVAGVFAVAYIASPLVAVRALIDAGKRGDEARLERMVDFPAFRDSLKDELNAALRAELRADIARHDNALSGLGMMLAPALVSGAVDAFVTPSAIASMVRTAEAPEPGGVDEPARPAADGNDDDGDVRQSYSYRGLNTFAVTLTDPDRPDHELDLLLERRGLFSWKLAGIDLPERA